MINRQDRASPIDNLTKRSFNYYGLGGVLYFISEAYWLNFSAYFLINQLGQLGNTIFLISQLIQAAGILMAWIFIRKLSLPFGNHIMMYIIGTVLTMIASPIIFLPGLSNITVLLIATICLKVGSAMSIYSHFTMISLVTNSRSRRKKLVSKISQFGLGGTFLAILLMSIISILVPFDEKYFITICCYVVLGGICSILFIYKIRQNQLIQSEELPQPGKINNNSINWFKQIRFYAYGIATLISSMYTNIITAVYPYYIKQYNNFTQIKYLLAVVLLYFSALAAAILARKAFMFTGIRPLISIGLFCSFISMLFYVFSYHDINYSPLLYIGTAITGISKVIILNCTINLINQMIGVKAQSRQFVYGFYMIVDKIVTGLVLYYIINNIMDQSTNVLHFSWIFLPFILYFIAWLIIFCQRTFLGQKPYSLVQRKVKLRIQSAKDTIVN